MLLEFFAHAFAGIRAYKLKCNIPSVISELQPASHCLDLDH